LAKSERHLDRLQNFNETGGSGLLDDARTVNRRDECRGAAVHDRNFRTIDFDGGVVHAHAAQGGEHMLGGGHHGAGLVAQNGGESGRGNGGGQRANFALGPVSVGADKNKTGIDVRRSENEVDGSTRMNADARHGDVRTERLLPAEFHPRLHLT